VPNEPWRIDVHHHVVPPPFVAAVARSGRSVRTPAWSPESALATMDILEREGIAPGARGETLSVSDFVRLANALAQSAKQSG